MSQDSIQVPDTGPVAPTDFADDINLALAALLSMSSGAGAPANGPSGAPVGGQYWLDTTANPNVLKLYDGASWVIVGYLDTSTHLFTPVTAAAFGAQTNIASGTTTSLGTILSRHANITGVTTITSFGNAADVNNPVYLTKFAGALTLTNSVTLILPGGANYTTAAGDMFWWQFEGSSTWRCIAYALASGRAIVSPATSGPVKIISGTVSGAAEGVIDLTGWPASYRAVDIYITELDVAAGADLQMLFRTGSSDLTAAQQSWASSLNDWSGSTANFGSAGNTDTKVVLAPTLNAAFSAWRITLSHDATGTTHLVNWEGNYNLNNASPSLQKLRAMRGAGQSGNAFAANTGISLKASTSTISFKYTAIGIPT